jgi:hypothetical protein
MASGAAKLIVSTAAILKAKAEKVLKIASPSRLKTDDGPPIELRATLSCASSTKRHAMYGAPAGAWRAAVKKVLMVSVTGAVYVVLGGGGGEAGAQRTDKAAASLSASMALRPMAVARRSAAMAPPLLIDRNTDAPGLSLAMAAQRRSASAAVGMSARGATISTSASCEPLEVGKVHHTPRAKLDAAGAGVQLAPVETDQLGAAQRRRPAER